MYVDMVQVSLLPSAVDLPLNEAECECPGVLALGVHVYACMHYTSVCILSVYVGYMVLASYTDPI